MHIIHLLVIQPCIYESQFRPITNKINCHFLILQFWLSELRKINMQLWEITLELCKKNRTVTKESVLQDKLEKFLTIESLYLAIMTSNLIIVI